jgi:hypothetical protein
MAGNRTQQIRRALTGLTIAGLSVFARTAAAVPLYARQTGQSCAACHNGFPELTPYGRLFKLNAYTFGGGQSRLPPIAFMTAASFTNTQAPQPGGAAPHFADNNNFAIDFFSMFYGGVLLPHVGMFGQITYDNIGKALAWDNTDIRFADAVKIDGTETILGVDVNNNPTVQDVWNTAPAWEYPWLASGVAPTPVAATVIEGALAQQVVGVTVNAYWNRLIYGEFGGYRTLGNNLLEKLGADANGNTINGVAPYWRFAIEPKWGPNSWEFGTFGLRGAYLPGGIPGFGTDHITDIALDSQYQYLTDVNSVSVQAILIRESDRFDSSFQQGIASNRNDHLTTFHIKTSYYYDQTYGGTLGWFRIDGTGDAALYGADSASNSPNSSGFIGELDYMPFNHGGPSFWPWLNVKFGLQYTYYTRFNGGTTNYDGAGSNATGNNTLYAFAWLAF